MSQRNDIVLLQKRIAELEREIAFLRSGPLPPVYISPAQERVVRLAGEGLGSIEIASRLFLAESTIKNHLTSVYRQLGITSRRELRVELFSDRGRLRHLNVQS